MIVSWYGVDGATYDVDRSNDSGVTWTSIAEDIAETSYTDTIGTSSSFYRVRVHGSSIWNPMFAGVASSSPAMCTLYGYVRDANGALFNGADVFMRVPSQRQFLGDAFFVTEEPVAVLTNSVGYWSMLVPQGLTVMIRIPIAKVDETVTIPALASVEFSSLL